MGQQDQTRPDLQVIFNRRGEEDVTWLHGARSSNDTLDPADRLTSVILVVEILLCLFVYSEYRHMQFSGSCETGWVLLNVHVGMLCRDKGGPLGQMAPDLVSSGGL